MDRDSDVDFSWYKGIAIIFLALLVLSNLFFSVASIYDGMSRNTFVVGPYYVSYVVVIGVCGIMALLFYLLYTWELQSGVLYSKTRTEMEDKEIDVTIINKELRARGIAQTSYPRFAWEVATFFSLTLVIYLFLLGIWGQFIISYGYNYAPNFGLSINAEDLMQFYSIQMAMAVLAFVSFIYCVDFLWVIVDEEMYVLNTTEQIKELFSSGKYTSLDLPLGKRKGGIFHQGTGYMYKRE